jgi:hypothetical protein
MKTFQSVERGRSFFGCDNKLMTSVEEKEKIFALSKSSLPGRHENISIRGAGLPGGLSGIEVTLIGPGIAKPVHTQFCYFSNIAHSTAPEFDNHR